MKGFFNNFIFRKFINYIIYMIWKIKKKSIILFIVTHIENSKKDPKNKYNIF